MTIVLICIMGFLTGITTYLFGFGGGFVVVPFVYQLLSASSPRTPNIMHIAVATSTAVMVFNALYASYHNYKKHKLQRRVIFPIIYFITIGAVVAAFFSRFIPDYLIKILFILYLMITIGDCLLRKGFFSRHKPQRLSTTTRTLGGVLIGSIATLLGVGGSVMTVPLLRRHGYSMEQSAATANPLTLPIAVMGSLFYATAPSADENNFYLGLINLPILTLLVICGTIGIVFAKKLPTLPDRFHAQIYLSLLLLVTCAICF